MKLGSVYPRYVGPRLIIPGGILEGGGEGMLDLLHRYRKHVLCIFRPCYENVTGEKENALYALIRLNTQTTIVASHTTNLKWQVGVPY